MKIVKLVFFIFIILPFYSCTQLKKSLGMEKNAPNEFLVVKKNDIMIPPDYNLLPPDSKSGEANYEKDDLKYILGDELRKNKKSNTSTIEEDTNLSSKAIDKKILNSIK